MNKDKRILYILTLITFAVLLIALFVDIGSSKIVGACIMLPLSLATWFIIKKRSSLSVSKREVLLLISVVGVVYVMLMQMTGTFFGIYRNPYAVDAEGVLLTVFPLAVIIVGGEVIRYVALSQKNTFVSIVTYLSCVISEVLMYSSLVRITNMNAFMDLVGMTVFPAITANIFYHYVSKRYGMIPNIVYRIITTLYIYFVPFISGMTDALSACIKIILPILLLALLSALYEKKKKNAKRKGEKISVLGTAITVAAVVCVAMLISCQFRFGALVIATDSMTGEINKGDMIIYEQYDDQVIKEGQVIVFKDGQAKVVHRVVRVENIGGELRYYTKGDANEDEDYGYRREADIVGLTDIKIAYVGYPTLWLHELFS